MENRKGGRRGRISQGVAVDWEIVFYDVHIATTLSPKARQIGVQWLVKDHSDGVKLGARSAEPGLEFEERPEGACLRYAGAVAAR